MKGTFGAADLTSFVLGPLSGRGSQISWTTQPSGTVGALKVFGGDGRSAGRAARIQHSGPTRVAELPQYDHAATGPALPADVDSFRKHTAHRLRSELQRCRSGRAGVLRRRTRPVHRPAGRTHYYLPVHGGAASVVLSSQGDFSGLCFGPAIAGYVGPFPGFPIPRIGS